ncbi:MAG TPA: hypothetical protein DCY25_01775 [Bacteroidales bacterium]|nr:hypothetical protein [Bacteroidales bacterium]
MADLTLALNAGHLKTGSACRSERIVLPNLLMRNERQLYSHSKYAGKQAFKNCFLLIETKLIAVKQTRDFFHESIS